MQLRQYKRLHAEHCCMALEGQSRSCLCPQLIRGISVLLSCKGPSPPAHLDSQDPTAAQLSQKAHPAHRGRGWLGQWEGGSPSDMINLTASHYSGSPSTIISITHPRCQFPLSYHSQSLFLPFRRLASVSGAVASGSDKCPLTRASLSTLRHSLMSWDSNIFARVFFTLRAVRREAGLWAQHSDMSFPICLRH